MHKILKSILKSILKKSKKNLGIPYNYISILFITRDFYDFRTCMYFL